LSGLHDTFDPDQPETWIKAPPGTDGARQDGRKDSSNGEDDGAAKQQQQRDERAQDESPCFSFATVSTPRCPGRWEP
jgi:hypothetical protein